MNPLPETLRLLAIMARLRDPVTGCRWDRAQTPESLAPYAIEEAYELAEAARRGDLRDWQDELGDVLLQVVFHAQIAQEQAQFDFEAVSRSIGDKLIRRHPHLFPGGQWDAAVCDDLTPEQVAAQWEDIKREERRLAAEARRAAGLPEPPSAYLDAVGAGVPPFKQAVKLTARAAAVGYTWTDPQVLLAKLREEVEELAEAVSTGAGSAACLDELGDVLFCATNLARVLQLDPEAALMSGIAKFRRRFGYIEQQLQAQGVALQDASLDVMVGLWGEARHRLG